MIRPANSSFLRLWVPICRRQAVLGQRRCNSQSSLDDPDLQLEYYRQWADYYRKWHTYYYGSANPYPGPMPPPLPMQPYDPSRQYPPFDQRLQMEQPGLNSSAEAARNNVVIWAMIFVTGVYILLSIEELAEEGAKPLPASSGLRDSHLATQLRNRRSLKKAPVTSVKAVAAESATKPEASETAKQSISEKEEIAAGADAPGDK